MGRVIHAVMAVSDAWRPIPNAVRPQGSARVRIGIRSGSGQLSGKCGEPPLVAMSHAMVAITSASGKVRPAMVPVAHALRPTRSREWSTEVGGADTELGSDFTELRGESTDRCSVYDDLGSVSSELFRVWRSFARCDH
jgi:hypothetical protein